MTGASRRPMSAKHMNGAWLLFMLPKQPSRNDRVTPSD